MKLYYFETPNPRLACAVARHLRLPLDYVRVDVTKGEQRQPEYLAINPNGKVPALVDGDLKLWEAGAIACHLARKAGSDLWPKDEAGQTEVIRWLSWELAHFSRHAGGLYFQRVIKPRLGLGEPDAAAIEEATRFFHQFARVLDSHLEGRAYLLGDRLTLADFFVARMLPYAREAQMPLEDYAEIVRWHGQLMALPAWRDPFPSEQARRQAA
ncbi:glutathione S-transferase family protein [Dokdonella soli]|uniref:Glutathione S-transferase family protein n=1 Tax=Dokdonella soli TaxID=529810 RepID=A0ABN1IDB2_9GAMM